MQPPPAVCEPQKRARLYYPAFADTAPTRKVMARLVHLGDWLVLNQGGLATLRWLKIATLRWLPNTHTGTNHAQHSATMLIRPMCYH